MLFTKVKKKMKINNISELKNQQKKIIIYHIKKK